MFQARQEAEESGRGCHQEAGASGAGGEERAVELRSEVRGWCRMAWDLDPCKDFSIDLE